jgi:signal transduction histidine kinase
MNQLWVRISLTYVAIVIFLIVIPSLIFITIHADEINMAFPAGEPILADLASGPPPGPFLARLVGVERIQILSGLIRILLSISFVGILVGVISSRGLAAPLNNLAKAARAVGSQDLTQRIDVKGSSEIREVALAFNAMAAALEEADDLRSNMLADIAHELRTPLTVIQGNLRAILDDVYELDKVEVARLYDQTRQLARLVDDLHDLALLEARQFSLNLSQQNLIEIINDVAAIYQPIFEDQEISLVLDLPDTISSVQADCARLTQCINNLINNALRHSSPGGTINIELTEVQDRATIMVRDDGAGIEPEHLPHIFNRFYRVDPDRSRKTGGSGLGLAITQALVQAQGGEITASSLGKDQGSQFIISLPLQV